MSLRYLSGSSNGSSWKKLEVRIHRSVTWTTVKHISLGENVKSIFPLGNDNTRSGLSNLNPQEIFEQTKIPHLKLTLKVRFESADTIRVITSNDSIIDIDHQVNAQAK